MASLRETESVTNNGMTLPIGSGRIEPKKT
jgi:hypothetical protein